VKFDFLGLKTLTVLDLAVRLVKRRGVDVDLSRAPLDDAKSYEPLARGETVGIFQLESGGMRRAVIDMRPDRFDDLIALVALYRPGPMDDIPTYISVKNGQEKPDYLHPSLKPILEETYGIMVYQEQVMQIARVLSGYSLGGADLLRRAMGKKIQSEMDAQRTLFVEGAAKNNVEDARASMIFDKVAKFAGYGFNKCHSAPYALVAYQTAYLKANHPVEFFAASMTLDMGNADKLGNFRRELERLQIPLLPPDINKSMAEFAVERTDEGKLGVRYALAAIKGVGRDAMNRLAEERATNGPFKDLFDVAERLDQRVINKRLLESLVKAGAYDSLNKNRAQTFGAVEALTRHSQATHESRGSNQNSLFGDDTAQRRPPLPKVPDWAPMERLQNEFSAIGFYLSSHPLAAYERSLERLGVKRAADLQVLLMRGVPGRIKLAGTVIDRQERTSAKGNRFAFVQCSDQSGAFELTVFSELLGSKRNLLEPGQAILVSVDGRLDGEQVKLTAQTVEKLDDAVANAAAGLRIELSDPTALEPLRKALEGKRGRSRVTLVVPMPDDSEAEVTLPGSYSIAAGLRDTIGGLPGIAQVEEI
jgi:DNA polymerase-3 subunit alpha